MLGIKEIEGAEGDEGARGQGPKGSIEGVGGGRRASDRLMKRGGVGNMSVRMWYVTEGVRGGWGRLFRFRNWGHIGRGGEGGKRVLRVGGSIGDVVSTFWRGGGGF